MSITDELRKEAQGHLRYLYTSGQAKHLLAIADRIDAAHEEYEGFCERLEDAAKQREEVTLFGMDYTPLPVDADGECIHIGDVMEWMPRDKTYQPVIHTVSGVGADVFFAWSGKSCQYAQYDAQAFRHYRQPTIEEVLTEFGIDWEHEDNCEDRAALLAEYAKRLKLAGEGE